MMKILLQANEIPIGSTVIKQGGNLHRKLLNDVKVVADGKTYANVHQQDCLFLMASQLDTLEAVLPTTTLEWVVQWEDEYNQLKEIINNKV